LTEVLELRQIKCLIRATDGNNYVTSGISTLLTASG